MLWRASACFLRERTDPPPSLLAQLRFALPRFGPHAVPLCAELPRSARDMVWVLDSIDTSKSNSKCENKSKHNNYIKSNQNR